MEKNSSHNNHVPLVRVKGSHRELGQQVGEACREQIQHHVNNTHVLIGASFNTLELTWDGAQIQARKYMPFAQECYPQYVEEMMGLAEGAGVAFGDVAVVNVLEAVTMDALHLSKCTSMAVNETRTINGHVIAAHNEDWLPEDEADVYLIHATPDDEPPYLAMTYGALLPNIGFNAYGIAQFCDSVRPDDSRIGIPRVLVSRAVLAKKSPGEAIREAIIPRRAAGYNHLIAHESGELYNVEVSARRFAILYSQDGCLVHTNHFLDSNMQTIEDEPDKLIGTQIRYFRASRLLAQTRKHSIETLQSVQQDHVNYPNSICNHAEENMDPLDREKTINSIIIDLTDKVMHISWGNPCANPYHTYYLDA
jgi:isopenicillin-N N-acyltransferase-like protein